MPAAEAAVATLAFPLVRYHRRYHPIAVATVADIVAVVAAAIDAGVVAAATVDATADAGVVIVAVAAAEIAVDEFAVVAAASAVFGAISCPPLDLKI